MQDVTRTTFESLISSSRSGLSARLPNGNFGPADCTDRNRAVDTEVDKSPQEKPPGDRFASRFACSTTSATPTANMPAGPPQPIPRYQLNQYPRTMLWPIQGVSAAPGATSMDSAEKSGPRHPRTHTLGAITTRGTTALIIYLTSFRESVNHSFPLVCDNLLLFCDNCQHPCSSTNGLVFNDF